MNDSEVYAFLDQTFKSVFNRDTIVISPELSAQDVLGWDSLKQVEITLALEERFGVRIRTKELARLSNVGDLVNLVVQKVGQSA
jgi:acyl carrier protein